MAKSLYGWPATAARLPSSNHPAGLFAVGNFSAMSLGFALNEKCNFEGVVPQAYAGGDINIVVYWSGGAGTSGSATWGAKYLGLADDEVFNGTLSAQATQADALTAVGDLQVATIAISSPSLTAGDYLVVEIELTSALTGGDALLRYVEFQEQ